MLTGLNVSIIKRNNENAKENKFKGGTIMKIRCLDKKDCFANADGYCICLTNNDFGGRRCSFYKTKTKAATERKKVEKQLKRKGKTGLIDMYNGRGQ